MAVLFTRYDIYGDGSSIFVKLFFLFSKVLVISVNTLVGCEALDVHVCWHAKEVQLSSLDEEGKWVESTVTLADGGG